MRHVPKVIFLALIAAIVIASRHSAADEPKKTEAKPQNPLVGTWKLVSAKYGGKEVSFPEGTTRIKHVTPTQFTWVDYDKEGKVGAALGGPYTLKGDKYVETPEYGVGQILQALKGKPQSFTWKVEGNKWFHNGKVGDSLTIEEVWERVQK
jgi:hypothetical protein